MPSYRGFPRTRPGQPILTKALERPRREVEALSRATVGRGLIVQTGPGGIPLYGLRNAVGLVLCRIGPDGFTARTRDDPDPGTDTLGVGTVQRYIADGATVTLSGADEDATSSYFVAIDGDFDGWFTELGGVLSLVTRHCQDAP